MAKVLGASAKAFVGAYDLSSYVNHISVAKSQDLKPSATMGDGAAEYTPGLQDGDAVLTGFEDANTSSAIDDVVDAAFTAGATGTVCTLSPSGTTAGNRAWIFIAKEGNAKVGSQIAELTTLEAVLKADGGIDAGIFLRALAAATATADSASINNSAATTNGGVASIHVTAINLTSATVKVQHSTNDSVWADLVTFSIGSTITSALTVVAAGTTVRQYLRVSISAFSGTTFTFTVAFARRV